MTWGFCLKIIATIILMFNNVPCKDFMDSQSKQNQETTAQAPYMTTGAQLTNSLPQNIAQASPPNQLLGSSVSLQPPETLSTSMAATQSTQPKLLLQACDINLKSTRPELKNNGTLLGEVGTLQFFDNGTMLFFAKKTNAVMLNTRLDQVTSIRNDGTDLIFYYNGANSLTSMTSGGIYDMFSFAGLQGIVGPALLTTVSNSAAWGAEAAYSNKINLRQWTDTIHTYYPNIKITQLDNKGTNRIAFWILGVFFGGLILLAFISMVVRSITG
jgi:hypothetical protein